MDVWTNVNPTVVTFKQIYCISAVVTACSDWYQGLISKTKSRLRINGPSWRESTGDGWFPPPPPPPPPPPTHTHTHTHTHTKGSAMRKVFAMGYYILALNRICFYYISISQHLDGTICWICFAWRDSDPLILHWWYYIWRCKQPRYQQPQVLWNIQVSPPPLLPRSINLVNFAIPSV